MIIYTKKILDLEYVFELLKFTGKLAITPTYNKKKEEISQQKYRHLLVIALLMSGCAYSVYGIVVYFFPFFTNTNAVLQLLGVIGMTTLNVVTIIVAAVNVKTWNTFIKLFRHLDKKLNYRKTGGSMRLYIAEVVFNNLIFFVLVIYDAFVWYSNYQWMLSKFYLINYVNYYFALLSILVILHFASALSDRYKKINTFLIKSNDLHNIFNSLMPKGSRERLNNLKSIYEVTDNYLILSELVEMFNKLFGWQILFTTEVLIIVLLDVSNNLFISLDFSQKTSDAFHDFQTIFLLILFSILLTACHSILIKYCEDVNKESRNTLTICYNLQETVDPISEERKELIILSDVVSLLKTRTNAAGFYDINRNLSSRIFSYLFSYSIVLIQFNKQSTPKDLFRNNNITIAN